MSRRIQTRFQPKAAKAAPPAPAPIAAPAPRLAWYECLAGISGAAAAAIFMWSKPGFTVLVALALAAALSCGSIALRLRDTASTARTQQATITYETLAGIMVILAGCCVYTLIKIFV